MSFSEGQSHLISGRTGSGHAFLPSNKHARLRTVPRFWRERFLQLELMQIACGCFYQRLPTLSFRRRLRRPLELRVSQRLLLLSPQGKRKGEKGEEKEKEGLQNKENFRIHRVGGKFTRASNSNEFDIIKLEV
jgi:hypothetical protein